jgi:hypothetical protein
MQFHLARSTSTLPRRVRSAEGREPFLTLVERTRLFAIAIVLAGASLFTFALLGTMVFLTDRHCGSEFNYYGCDIPTAGVVDKGDQVAHAPRTR